MKLLRPASALGILALVGYPVLAACDGSSADPPGSTSLDGSTTENETDAASSDAAGGDGGGNGDAGTRGFKSVSLAYRGAQWPEAFALGDDDELYWGYATGTNGWRWKKLSRTGKAKSAPEAVSWGSTRIDYAVVGDCMGNTGTACQAYWDDINAPDGGAPPEWSVEFDLGEPQGGMKTTLAIASPAASRLFLFGLGGNDTAYATYWNGGIWSGWEAVPGSPGFASLDALASSSASYETTTIIGRDTTGVLATATHVRPIPTGTAEWLGWSTLPTLANGVGRPTITRRIDIGLNPLVVYSRGGADGRLHRTRGSLDIDGSSMWQPWTDVTGGPATVGDPDCASPGQALIAGGANARDLCGVIGPGGAVWLFTTVDGVTFEWRELPLHD